MLRNFDPRWRVVLTTDASGLAVAAILTQPDDKGHQHLAVYKSSKLTAAKRNYSAHILELLAVVHALHIFWHYLLGSRAPLAEGCWSDFDLRTYLQAITAQDKQSSESDVRSLARSDRGLPIRRHAPARGQKSYSLTDPLSRRGFVDCDGPIGPAPTTGDPDPGSQQSLTTIQIINNLNLL